MKAVSFRLTELESECLKLVAKRYGQSQTEIDTYVTYMVRDLLKTAVHHYMVGQRLSYVQALKKLKEEKE